MKTKYIIVISLLLLVIIANKTIPQTKYMGTNFISSLEIPSDLNSWKGRDISDALNINANNTMFNFINDATAYQYVNNEGKSLIFLILDAGNFHHPKVCFTASGYTIKELPDTEFESGNHTFQAHTLFTERENQSFLSFYWIVIDKNIAHEWIEQKFKQLYFSLLNKKRVGLMVRIDIPARPDNYIEALELAREFIPDLRERLNADQAGYIFGDI